MTVPVRQQIVFFLSSSALWADFATSAMDGIVHSALWPPHGFDPLGPDLFLATQSCADVFPGKTSWRTATWLLDG
jgi:hypothetical protein